MEIAVYRRVPVNVAAIQVTDESYHDAANWLTANDIKVFLYPVARKIVCYTPRQTTIKFGDWLVRSSEGYFHPCSDGYFQKTYHLNQD